MSLNSVSCAAQLVRTFEGLRLRPYLCPAGYWTIGYGCRFLMDGTAVTANTPSLTAQQAERLVEHTLVQLVPVLRRLVHVPLTPQQEGALLDWQFNLGTAAIAGSTLLHLLNAGQTAAAGAQLLHWDHMHRNGHLVRVPGLTRRRRAEWLLFTSTETGNAQPVKDSA